MKNIIVFLLLQVFTADVFSQSADFFRINGSISDLKEGMIYISYPKDGKTIVDSSKIINGNFKFSGTITEPVLANLRMVNNNILDNKAVFVFLEPVLIDVVLKNNPFSALKIQGSETHQELMEWRTLQNNLKKQYESAFTRIRTEKDEGKLRKLEDSLILYNKEKKRLEYDFIKKHPQSYAAAFILSFNYQNYTVPELKGIYNNMGSKLQESHGKELLEHISEIEASSKGAVAADFSGKDFMTSKNFSLLDNRGKYVLIDFWGSWCQPCISMIPSLVKEYNKYKDENIVFLSIAYDSEPDLTKSRTIVNKYSMNWINLWQDKNDEEGSITEKYDIHVYPTTILIDPEGKIILRSEGTEGFLSISRLLETRL